MELKEFISNVMLEMRDLKNDPLKTGYLVEELEFELVLTEINAGRIGVGIMGIGANGSIENQNAQKVKVKLVPRNSQRKISMTI